MTLPKKKTILLVEDEALIALSASRTIRSFGYEVVVAHSGKKAIELALADKTVSLILMDIDLGRGLDGPQAAQQILKVRNIPVVFHTSHAEQEYVDRVKEISRYGYVVKNSGDFVLHASIEMAYELFEANEKTTQKIQELQESEESLAITLQSIGDAVIATDIQGRITRMNKTAENLTGWSLAAARNQPLQNVFKIINALTRREAADPVAQVLKTCKVVGLANHTVLVAKDGKEYQISDSAAPIRDNQGAVQGVILVFSDVTEKYAAAEKVRVSEQRFKSIVESSPMGMHMYKLNAVGQLVFTGGNPAADRILGVDNSIFVGKTIGEAFPPLLATEVPEQYTRVAQSGGLWKTEQIDYDDTKIRGAFEVVAFQTSANAMAAMFTDITVRKRAEVELQRSEALYHNLAETSHDLIWRCDYEGRYTYLNPAWEEVTGRKVAEMLGRHFSSFQTPEYAARDFKEFARLLQGGMVKGYETVHLGHDGREIHMVFNAVFLRNDKGAIVGTQGTAHDITSSKLAAKEIERQLTEKEVLLKEVHHRIKNNLLSVEMLLSLQAEAMPHPAARAALKDAIGRVTSMRILYEKLLPTRDYKDLSVKNYLESIVGTIVELFPPGSGITVESRIDDFTVEVRQLFPLGVIINELITNSMKYAFVNRPAGLIGIDLHVADKQATLTVQDNGGGLPAADESRVAQGFGLTLVRMLCAQLGGELVLENRAGTRCTVVFEV